MKTLTLLLTIAGISAASAETQSLDVRQLIEQRWMTAAPVSETWTCVQFDAATVRAAFEDGAAADLTYALNDDPRPEIARGPMDPSMPLMAAGQ